jgi:hypothetical protein
MLPEHERIHKRQKEAILIIDELTTAIQKRLTDGNILPKAKFREALTYFCGLIPYLKNYTKFAWARQDNNVAERAVHIFECTAIWAFDAYNRSEKGLDSYR